MKLGEAYFQHNSIAQKKEKLHNSFLDKIDREYYFYQQYRTSLSTLFWVYTLERHPGEAKELGLVGPALLANFS